ncbi:hypothetical protein [Vibrio parahaemolyticus]|uniref:hypothetical protein n=1 Tax=Vibrio parahaemolyticus TaxID=670 RepID=UPI001112A564|nr:hypothetical protein [Vibrio parahaemolyticus]
MFGGVSHVSPPLLLFLLGPGKEKRKKRVMLWIKKNVIIPVLQRPACATNEEASDFDSIFSCGNFVAPFPCDGPP